MFEKILEQYGLNKKEAEIYLLCLEYGTAQPAKIAAKLGMHRSTCYDTLSVLRKKGVVVETKKGGILYYAAENPEKLLQDLANKYQAFQSIVPDLISLTQKIGIKPKIKIYEGLEGMKNLYHDTLTSKEQILAYCGNHQINKELKEYFVKEYIPQRIKKKLYAKIIACGSEDNKKYQKNDTTAMRETRIIEKQYFSIDCEINIYGPNKVMVSLYNQEEMTGFVIESNFLYNTMKSIFTYIWETANGKAKRNRKLL